MPTVGVAVRVNGFVERATAADDRPQPARVDQFPQEDEVRLHRGCGAGNESRPAAEMDQAARDQAARDRSNSI